MTRGIQNLLQQEPCKGAETDSRAKFGKETIAGAHRRPKWVPHYGAQADSGRAQDAQALLRLCSGSAQACSPSAQVCSPSAQVKAAVAHVRRLKRNQRKGKLILSLWGIRIELPVVTRVGESPSENEELHSPESGPEPAMNAVTYNDFIFVVIACSIDSYSEYYLGITLCATC